MTNLVTLAEFKEYATIASPTFDTKLNSLITFVSDFIKQYCGRTFIDNYDSTATAYTTITEYWNGGYPSYSTKEFPIQSVDAVSLSVDFGTTYEPLALGTDYVWDRMNDNISIFAGESNTLVNSYKFEYKGGFSETPPALKVATLDLVNYYHRQDSKEKRMQGSENIVLNVQSSDLPPHIKRVLDLYRVI